MKAYKEINIIIIYLFFYTIENHRAAVISIFLYSIVIPFILENTWGCLLMLYRSRCVEIRGGLNSQQKTEANLIIKQ